MNKNIFAFSATDMGYNHIKNNKVCEDWSNYYNDEKMHICVVADGHGSDNYPRTDRGAKYAVDSAIKCIIEFVNNAEPEQVLKDEHYDYILLEQLAKSILLNWYQLVEEDFDKNSFSEKELEKVSEKYRRRYQNVNSIEKAYGCTLIAFVVTEKYSFGLQIGDGKCVVVNTVGDFEEPIPWDDNCQMNVTTSICDSDAIEEFRFCVLQNMPVAVFCGSDGIDDSYANSEELYALYRSILKIFGEHGQEIGEQEIKEYLPILTKKGSGDDVSIGTIINLEKLLRIAPLMEIKAQLFKKSIDLDNKKRKLTMMEEKKNALTDKAEKLRYMIKELAFIEDEILKLKEQSIFMADEINVCEKEYAELKKSEEALSIANELKHEENLLKETETDNLESITPLIEEQLNNSCNVTEQNKYDTEDFITTSVVQENIYSILECTEPQKDLNDKSVNLEENFITSDEAIQENSTASEKSDGYIESQIRQEEEITITTISVTTLKED